MPVENRRDRKIEEKNHFFGWVSCPTLSGVRVQRFCVASADRFDRHPEAHSMRQLAFMPERAARVFAL